MRISSRMRASSSPPVPRSSRARRGRRRRRSVEYATAPAAAPVWVETDARPRPRRRWRARPRTTPPSARLDRRHSTPPSAALPSLCGPPADRSSQPGAGLPQDVRSASALAPRHGPQPVRSFTCRRSVVGMARARGRWSRRPPARSGAERDAVMHRAGRRASCTSRQILADAGLLRDARVTRVEHRIIGEEKGFLSVTARVAIDYDGPADGAPRPASLVVKIEPPAGQFRDLPSAASTRSSARSASTASWRPASPRACRASCSPRARRRQRAGDGGPHRARVRGISCTDCGTSRSSPPCARSRTPRRVLERRRARGAGLDAGARPLLRRRLRGALAALRRELTSCASARPRCGSASACASARPGSRSASRRVRRA